VFALSPTLAYTHDYRPLLVRVIEEPQGRYLLSWQPSPVLKATDQPLVKLAGAGCKLELSEIIVSDTRRAIYRCDDPSTPLLLELIYPNDNPSLPTLLNLSRADGTLIRMTGAPSSWSIMLSESQPDALRTQAYLLIGFDHIMRGLDHLIFLSFLWLITGTGWTLIRALTGFTLGHSATLALATTGVATLSAPFIESMIALSIVLMAAESLKKDRRTLTHSHPVVISTLFGLLHGFGFAGYLREVGLPKDDELVALLMFNIGVEAGQIAFIIATAAAGVVIKKGGLLLLPGHSRFSATYPLFKPRTIAAYAGGTLAAYWLMERAVGGLSPLTTIT
jgi:hydrogenase/urease accessory protein HupE